MDNSVGILISVDCVVLDYPPLGQVGTRALFISFVLFGSVFICYFFSASCGLLFRVLFT